VSKHRQSLNMKYPTAKKVDRERISLGVNGKKKTPISPTGQS